MRIGRHFVIEHSWLLWAPPMLMFIGAAMNAAVVAANHGQMPVLMPPSTMLNPADIIHHPFVAGVRLKFLTDWIALNASGQMYSPGDMFEKLSDFFGPIFLGAWCALHFKVKHD